MAKELMEIGGFITSGAEIVNHDASLSGNGTVDSPLGLNEAVLWSGSYESTGSITLSESYKNFELIRVEFVTNDNISFTSVFNSAEQNTELVLYGSYVRSTVTGISIKASQYTLTNTTITLSRGYEVAIGQSATQSSGNKITIKRVIGINRLSASN